MILFPSMGKKNIPKTITAKATIGANLKIVFLAFFGIISSFVMSLMKSAKGCKIPDGPVKDGPTLFCILASIFRSIQSQKKVKKIMKAKPGKTRILKNNSKVSIFFLSPIST